MKIAELTAGSITSRSSLSKIGKQEENPVSMGQKLNEQLNRLGLTPSNIVSLSKERVTPAIAPAELDYKTVNSQNYRLLHPTLHDEQQAAYGSKAFGGVIATQGWAISPHSGSPDRSLSPIQMLAALKAYSDG